MKIEKTDNGVRYSDPAMVMVGFSRQTHGGGGDGISLFGSSIKNNNVISLHIYQAEVKRDLSQDWYHTREPIIEILLSPLQFAELLTTMNVGGGVPGTLIHHNGENFTLPKMPEKAEEFKEEIGKDFEEIIHKINEAGKIIENLIDDPKPIGKQVRKQLKDLVSSFRNTIEHHFPFILKQFSRQLARTVTEAKAEVDAFVEHTIVQTGIEELKKRVPQITEMTDENNNGETK